MPGKYFGPPRKEAQFSLGDIMLMIMIMFSNHDFQPSSSTGYNHDKSRTSENGDDAKAPVHKHFYVHSHIGRFCQLSALGGSQDTC